MSDPASPEAQMSSKADFCNETDKDCKSGGTTEKPELMSSNLSPNSPNSPNAEGSMNVKSGSKSEENSQEFVNSEEAEADSDNTQQRSPQSVKDIRKGGRSEYQKAC